jgi:hypothetical protein
VVNRSDAIDACVLQGRAHECGGINHPSLDQVLVAVRLRVEAFVAGHVLDPLDDDRAFMPRVGGNPPHPQPRAICVSSHLPESSCDLFPVSDAMVVPTNES